MLDVEDWIDVHESDLSGLSSVETGHHVGPGADGLHIEAWAPSRSRCLEEFVRGVVETFANADTDADADRSRALRGVPLEIGAALDEEVDVLCRSQGRASILEGAREHQPTDAAPTRGDTMRQPRRPGKALIGRHEGPSNDKVA